MSAFNSGQPAGKPEKAALCSGRMINSQKKMFIYGTLMDQIINRGSCLWKDLLLFREKVKKAIAAVDFDLTCTSIC